MTHQTVDAFMTRARSALQMPTLYWLGHGGWQGPEGPQATPGRPINIHAALAQLQASRKAVYDQYMEGLAQNGLQQDDLPKLACDCSGFLCWALGVARTPAPIAGSWIYTPSIYADALHSHALFVKLDQASVGSLLVYPGVDDRDEARRQVGHVAIVSQVQNGRATKIIHCAPENIAIAPADGQPRNAIAETGIEKFSEHPEAIVVAWKAHRG